MSSIRFVYNSVASTTYVCRMEIVFAQMKRHLKSNAKINQIKKLR